MNYCHNTGYTKQTQKINAHYQIFLVLQLIKNVKMIAEKCLQQAELFRSTETIFDVVIEGNQICPYELHFNTQAITLK